MINLDFADVTTIMKDSGYAHMGVGVASGRDKAAEAANLAIKSPLMETSIKGARGVIVHVSGSPDLELEDVYHAAELVESEAHPDVNLIFGAGFDDSMEDEIRVTVIATQFDEDSRNSASAGTTIPEPAREKLYTTPPAPPKPEPKQERKPAPQEQKTDPLTMTESEPLQHTLREQARSQPDPFSNNDDDPFIKIAEIFKTK